MGSGVTAPAVPAPRSAEWHAERAAGIGCSELPILAGVSPYRTPSLIDVYEQKLGLQAPNDETPAMRLGRIFEDAIADAFAEQTGHKVRRWNAAVHYREWPVLFGHLDRVVGAQPLECKLRSSSRGWGEEGSADVPPDILVQVMGQIACKDSAGAHVAAVFPTQRELRTFWVPRDDALIADLVGAAKAFWTDHVLAGVPPEPDGSDGYGTWLRHRYPRDDGDELVATPEQQLLAVALRDVRGRIASATKAEAELEQRLQTGMAAASVLIGPGFRATWRQTKDRNEADWKAIAAAVPELVAAHTTTKPGSRPFLVKFTEEETES